MMYIEKPSCPHLFSYKKEEIQVFIGVQSKLMHLQHLKQALCKIGQEVVCDKFKEMLKEKHEGLNSNGKTNNTIFVPKERMN